MEVKIKIEGFLKLHRDRINLLKNFVDNKVHGRLIYQISFLGFESLAKLLYPQEDSSKKRFINILSKVIENKDAEKMYTYWRNPLIHEGFITLPWTMLEGWGENDISFLFYPNSLKSSTEFPPESIILIYDHIIDYVEETFKKENIKEKILTDSQ